MTTIYKYTLEDVETIIYAPIKKFLTVQVQGNKYSVWAEVNLENKIYHTE